MDRFPSFAKLVHRMVHVLSNLQMGDCSVITSRNFLNTFGARWEKSGDTVLLISCPSLYPYHSRLATSKSAGLAAFEDGALYRCYRQMRNSEFSEGRMEIHDENRSRRASVSSFGTGRILRHIKKTETRDPEPPERKIVQWREDVLRDNARPHVSRQTQELLTKFGWTIVPPSPLQPRPSPK
ncbi:hypothetical protein J6590_001370 [Homalodisca vitripennis]|nr:hypothetical protein J6590_001370 [Homalodisca vitripennis]